MGTPTKTFEATTLDTLQVKPGNVLLVTMPPSATPVDEEHCLTTLRRLLNRHGHRNVAVILIPDGMTIAAADKARMRELGWVPAPRRKG